jgi:ribose transport system substrate-binding protein
MAKRLSIGAMALLALTTPATIGFASENYIFALVPRNTDSPYFDDALAGCKKAEDETKKAAKLNAAANVVNCLYIGPGRNGDSDAQAQIVSDLISHGVDGIAVAPSDVSKVATALRAAGAANIPVVTWYSDLSAKDAGLRAAFVGSDNYQIGVDIAKIVMENKPKGGVICIQSASAASSNDNERIQGIRDTLAAKPKDAPVARLNGQNGWKEEDGCPLFAADDAVLANQQIEDILAGYPKLDAFVLASALAQLRPDAYTETISKYKERLASGQLIVVSSGALPTQIQLLRDALSSGQVGQRPFEMGYRAMYLLKDLKEGKPTPTGPIHPNLSVCTLNNFNGCVGDVK